MRVRATLLSLGALLAFTAEAGAQARPPSQRSGPITIFGEGSSGPGGLFTASPNFKAPKNSLNELFSRAKFEVYLESYDQTNGANYYQAFVDANNYCAKLKGCTIRLRDGVRYPMTGMLALGRNVSIRGAGTRADPGNPFGVTTEYFNYLKTGGALILGDNSGIDFGSNGGMEGVLLLRSNLKLDGTDLPTDYSGNCLTTGSASRGTDSVYLRDNAILGCGTAFGATSSARLLVRGNVIDANTGVVIGNSGDFGRYEDNHLYGVLQANATGQQAFSLRSGPAFGFYGTNVAGMILNNNFSYGYALGIDAQVNSHLIVTNQWIDGPTNAQGKPLNPDSVGIRFGNVDYQEPMFTNVRICCQGTGVQIGNGTAGAYQFSNIQMFGVVVGWNVSSNNLQLSNFQIRGYDTGFIFNSADAAYTAGLFNGMLLDRNAGATSPLDINAGSGSPNLFNVVKKGGGLDIANDFSTVVTQNAGVVNVPSNKDRVLVNNAGSVTNILPIYDGKTVTLEFAQSGNPVTGGKFVLASSFTSSKIGASITFRYSRYAQAWVEVSRGAQ